MKADIEETVKYTRKREIQITQRKMTEHGRSKKESKTRGVRTDHRTPTQASTDTNKEIRIQIITITIKNNQRK